MTGIIVAFEGRLGQDAELTFARNGNPMASFSCAVETAPAKDGKASVGEWIRVVVFGDGAETLVPQLGKGDLAYIEGRLSLNRWTGTDGKERSGLNVVATLVQPMGKIGKRTAVAAMQSQQQPAPPPQRPMGAEPQRGQRPTLSGGREVPAHFPDPAPEDDAPW